MTLKAHYVLLVGGPEHVGLRVVPRKQKYWTAPSNVYSTYFKKHHPIGGDLKYLTIGAEQVPLSGLCTSGKLNFAFNRSRDFFAPSTHAQVLPIAPLNEDSEILELLQRSNAYPNNTVDYSLDPENCGAGYNSNSFIHGLLDAAGYGHISNFWIAALWGWSTPVPLTLFIIP